MLTYNPKTQNPLSRAKQALHCAIKTYDAAKLRVAKEPSNTDELYAMQYVVDFYREKLAEAAKVPCP